MSVPSGAEERCLGRFWKQLGAVGMSPEILWWDKLEIQNSGELTSNCHHDRIRHIISQGMIQICSGSSEK